LGEAVDKIRARPVRVKAVGSNETHECDRALRHVTEPSMMVDRIKRCLDKDIGI
jgi:hypothetical protein